MTTERNTSSVLAKLMGIDRPLPSRKTRGRRRVLSENYLRDVSSVIHVEKSVLNANASVFDMDDDGDHDMFEEAVESSEILACGNAVSGLNDFCRDTRMTSKRNEETFSPRTPSSHLVVSSATRVSEAEKKKSSESHLKQPRSSRNINSGIFSGSTNKRQKTVSGVTNIGLGLQERRKTRLRDNGMKSTVSEIVSSKEIAKQVTNQVKHSVWHSCIKALKSEGRVDNRDADECGEISPSAKHLMDSEIRCEALSSDPTKRSEAKNTLKTKKTRFESRRASKYFLRKPQDQIKFVGTPRSNTLNAEDGNSRTLVSSNVYRCQVTSARFLSAPTLFPSAWVPRTKERRFSLDRNWCSRSGNQDGNLCNESSVDNLGDDKRSVLTIDAAKVKEESTIAVFSDTESQTCRKVCEILNVKADGHFSQGISLVAIRRDSFPSNVNTNEVTLDEKMIMCSKLQREQLPIKASKNDLFDDAAPSQNDFVLKHERKSTSPPGSPVSSLEGPEACRPRLNVTVNSKETSIPHCLDDDSLGLQPRLHFLEALSTESGSEGPGMAVSSDVSDGGGSPCCYREDLQISQCTRESCVFSYLVDVLTESGLMTGKLEAENDRRFSGSYVLDPSVFDFLEKKFGKSTAGERSERRLLFDRINIGLVEILQPFVGIQSWRKPVVKRLSVRQSWEFIEEDLWSLLVNQEEESKNDEIEWLDFEEDVKFIVQEIQSLVIDELIEEYLSMEMFNEQVLQKRAYTTLGKTVFFETVCVKIGKLLNFV
ncbi:hypothetical protein RND81_08G176200 [Saponaria officinalis]|uniref:DUF4378 domain-containing protein n=1 Tax=Saponaria officinalis TaxID=3572 RepID=A0AAW1J9U6_SAPOF